MKTIILTHGKITMVDDADFDKLNQWKWHYTKHHYGKGKVHRNCSCWIPNNRHKISMHRQIASCPTGLGVDHRDHDTLNNQRHNLRVCTSQENSCNMGPHKKGSSKYKGISWRKDIKKWRAQITTNYTGCNIGYYRTEIEAAKAYDKKAKELFGEYAYTNF